MPEYQVTCRRVYVYTHVEAPTPAEAIEKATSEDGMSAPWEIEWNAESAADFEAEEL